MNAASNQYYQVLRTYWRRPLVLVLAALFLVCYWFLAFGGTDQGEIDIAPSVEISWFRTGNFFVTTGANFSSALNNQFGSTAELLEHVNPEDVRGLELTKVSGEQSPLPDWNRFRNLKALSLQGYKLTSDEVDRICQLPRLEMLELYLVELPAGGLRRLGQTVSVMDLRTSLLVKHADEISQMSQVRLLSLTIVEETPDLLEHVCQAPRLEELTLEGGRSFTDFDFMTQNWTGEGNRVPFQLSENDIERIRRHPTLREIYADWPHVVSKEEINDETLLPVRALPLEYPRARQYAILKAGFSTAVLFVILTLQVWAHFVSPAAVVVPNYATAHRRVAAGILTAGVLLQWLALLRYGFGFLPGLALVLIVPAACCLFVQVYLTGSKLLQWLMIPVVFGVVFPSMYALMDFKIIASDAIWFLRGHMPLLSLSIIVIAVLVVLWTLKSLPAITGLVNEKFAALPILWYSDRFQQLQGWNRNHWALRLFNAGLRGLRYRKRTTLQMAGLWRKGNPFRAVMILMIGSLVIGVGLIPHITRHFMFGEPVFGSDISWVAGSLAGLSGAAALLPAFIWWGRCANLELESLKPVSRRALRTQLYLALALDHWVVWLGLFGFIVASDWEAFGGLTALTGARVLLGLAAAMWMLATNANVFVYQRGWVVVGWMIAFAAAAGAVLGTVVEQGQAYPAGSSELTQLYFVSALVAVAAAIGLNVVMYRAMLRREWG